MSMIFSKIDVQFNIKTSNRYYRRPIRKFERLSAREERKSQKFVGIVVDAEDASCTNSHELFGGP